MQFPCQILFMSKIVEISTIYKKKQHISLQFKSVDQSVALLN